MVSCRRSELSHYLDCQRFAASSTWVLAVAVGCSSSSSGPAGQNNAAGTPTVITNSGGAASTSPTSGGVAVVGGGFGAIAAVGGKTAGGAAAGGTNSGSGVGGSVSVGGNVPLGGATSGGTPSGGKVAGGTATGGTGTGGIAPGGAPAGGKAAVGGTATGGKATGGNVAGATSAGGTNAAGSGGCLDGPAVVVPAGYNLVWADEFNVDGSPDSSNWGYETGFVRNEEAQWYQPDNARVEKGCLVVEARRERKANPNYQAGSTDWKLNRQYAEYTASSLRTMGKRTWQYGRFEMRGRIKTQAGLWPAWWTLGVAKEWPSCGEIDIMEYYAGMVRANVACGTATRWQAKWDGAAWNVATFTDKDWQNKFHVWRMDWDDIKIDLYLDDKLVNTSNLGDMLNSDGSSPFKQAHYVLLNLAIGGVNGGDPSNTAFPSLYEVDYVRVFQKQ